MAEQAQPYQSVIYYALALDPVHIGAGGMQMGRVDNPIIREAGTGLPKIPATSLAGVARTYTAMRYPEKYLRRVVNEEGQEIYESCAGRGTLEKPRTCGQPDCPVCIPYGFSLPEGADFPSMAQFFDPQILFFPATSMVGPVWVTSPSCLQALVKVGELEEEMLDIRLRSEHGYRLQTNLRSDKLNLGWLLLEIAVKASPLAPAGLAALKERGIPGEVLGRLVLVPDPLFPHIVNNNLEVRTSVAIDPATGAALKGALFTYEAIPRSTVFWFQVVYKNPGDFLLDGKPIPKDIAWVREQVEMGLQAIEYLGLGGMVSRGMGRTRVLNLS